MKDIHCKPNYPEVIKVFLITTKMFTQTYGKWQE